MKDLNKKLDDLARAKGCDFSFAAHQLQTGEVIGRHADRMVPLASTYKIAIAVTALRLVADGKLALTDQIEIVPNDYVAPGPVSDNLIDAGTCLPFLTLLRLMMTHSDNSATDVVLRVIGGPSVVQNCLSVLQVAPLNVSRNTRNLIRDYFAFAPLEQMLADGATMAQAMTAFESDPAMENHFDVLMMDSDWQKKFHADPQDKGTPAAMIDLLGKIVDGRALPDTEAKLLLSIMEGCVTGDNRIRAGLPEGVLVANKTGSLYPHCGSINDAGIVTLPNGKGRLALAIFCPVNAHDYTPAEDLIAVVTRLIFDHFVER